MQPPPSRTSPTDEAQPLTAPSGELPDTSAPDLTAILSRTPSSDAAPPTPRVRPIFVVTTMLSAVGFSAALTLLLELFR